MNDSLAGAAKGRIRTDSVLGTSAIEEVRAWTIRNIDYEVIDKSRAAARQRGMKIGAWVAAQLRQAVGQDLRSESSGVSDGAIDQLKSMIESIAQAQTAEAERMRRLESEVSDMIKAQNGILCHLLQSVQK